MFSLQIYTLVSYFSYTELSFLPLLKEPLRNDRECCFTYSTIHIGLFTRIWQTIIHVVQWNTGNKNESEHQSNTTFGRYNDVRFRLTFTFVKKKPCCCWDSRSYNLEIWGWEVWGLRVGVKVESCAVVFPGARFLFTCLDIFAVGCIV